ncbi:MAG: hypothetical protein P4M12_05575 [Gammaproteobacteria bacterium]|nr:hypothetical protein [Gammaproteobacteria bacterium]
MKFNEIISRLTGISCPVFGVSWNPPETDRAIAQRLVTFLEDRRVLYTPSEIEVPHHCVQSVIKIREFLTIELTKVDTKDVIIESCRAMRSACRKFLNTVQAEKNGRIVHFANNHGHYASWEFNQALGEMRGIFGVHIARIAAQYGLDIEDDLAKILPEADNEG